MPSNRVCNFVKNNVRKISKLRLAFVLPTAHAKYVLS